MVLPAGAATAVPALSVGSRDRHGVFCFGGTPRFFFTGSVTVK
jgi:hypothetical protein